MLLGSISDGQYGAVGGEHSDAVTGVVNAGSYVEVVLCFRLRLTVSLYSAYGLLEERPPPREGKANRTASRMGTCPQNVLWLRCGSGRGTPKRPLHPQERVGRCARVQCWRLDTGEYAGQG